MDDLKPFCKLCKNVVGDENFKVIDDVVQHIIGLLLKSTLDNETPNIICKICYSKLIAALNFKSICLYTDNIITPYVDLKNPIEFDLKAIYVEQKGNKEDSRMLNDMEICRLCLQPTSIEHKSVEQVPFDYIQKYIPEINFAVSADPAICLKCHDELCIHGAFVKDCLDVNGERDKNAIKVEQIFFSNSGIKTEEIEIKYEETDDVEMLLQTLSETENDAGGTYLPSQSDLMDPEESRNPCEGDELKPTKSVQSNSARTESQALTSDAGNGKRKRKYRKIYKPTREVKVFKCEECAFESTNNGTLKRHQIIHKDPSEVLMYECGECDYKCLQKGNLKIHQLRHKDPSEVEMYRCGKCDYKTIEKGKLKRHQLRHEDLSGAQTYTCGDCDYKTAERNKLKRHESVHKDPSGLQLYKCDNCDYKSSRKRDLKRHQSSRKHSPKEDYTCDKCRFETKYKWNFVQHQLTHREASEVPMYTCDACDYKSVRKNNLKQHQRKHEGPSRTYEYRECDLKWNKTIV